MDKSHKIVSKVLIVIGVILFIGFLVLRAASFSPKENIKYKEVERAKDLDIENNEDLKSLLQIVIEEKDVNVNFNSMLILRDGNQNQDKYRGIEDILEDKVSDAKVFIVDVDDIYNLYKDNNDIVKKYLDKIKFKDGDLLLYDKEGKPMKINGNTMISNKIKPVGDLESKELIYVKTNIIKNHVNIEDVLSELNK